MSEKFPWHYTSAALMSVMASIQSIIFALFKERDDWNQWKLGWDIKLFTALFSVHCLYQMFFPSVFHMLSSLVILFRTLLDIKCGTPLKVIFKF